MTKQVFSVGGLHCEGCAKSVTAILREQPGAAVVTVDLGRARAEIETTDAFDVKAAIQAVAASGFSMRPA